MFNAPPKSLLDISGNLDFGKIKDLFSVIKSADKTLDFMRALLTRAKELLEGYFEEEFVRASLARLAGEMSIPPSQKTSAIGGMMTSLRHNPGVARPKGGTGAVTQALLKLVKSKGGVVLTYQSVETVLVDNNRAVGVRLKGDTEY